MCRCVYVHAPGGCHLYVVHHLQIKVVLGVLQDQGAAHIGRRIVEIKNDIVGLGAPLGSEHLVDFLGSLHLVGQIVSTGSAAECTHTQLWTLSTARIRTRTIMLRTTVSYGVLRNVNICPKCVEHFPLPGHTKQNKL